MKFTISYLLTHLVMISQIVFEQLLTINARGQTATQKTINHLSDSVDLRMFYEMVFSNYYDFIFGLKLNILEYT